MEPQQLQEILALSAKLKQEHNAELGQNLLANKTLAMLFAKKSKMHPSFVKCCGSTQCLMLTSSI